MATNHMLDYIVWNQKNMQVGACMQISLNNRL